MPSTLTKLMTVAACVAMAGCTAAQRNYSPVIDYRTSPNGGANYSQDLAECQQLAAQRSPVENTVENAAVGAVAGALVGGVIGSFSGNFGKGAGIGAAVGGTGGALKGGYEGHTQQETIVMNCMQGRGYNVIGR